MADYFFSCILLIKGLSKPCRKYHRKLQTFTVVSTHDLNRLTVLTGHGSLTEIHLIFLHAFNISYEMKESMVTDLLIISCFCQQHLHVGKTLFSSWKCPNLIQISGLCQDLPQQIMNRCVGCSLPVVLHLSKEPLQLLTQFLLFPVFCIGSASIIESRMIFPCPDLCQLRGCESTQQSMHGSCQRDLLGRIIKNTKIRQQCLHFHSLEISFSGLRTGRDPFLLQHSHKGLAPA